MRKSDMTDDALEVLKDELRTADAMLQKAKAERARIISEILAHPLIADAINHMDGGRRTVAGLVVETGWYRHWDEGRLLEIRSELEQSEAFSDETFPFEEKTVLSENRKATKTMEHDDPDLWSVYAEALELTPKTPTIRWKE